jgi:hypothetical protein
LAGEIRKPGSISLTTLQLLSLIDQELAQIISEVRGWLFGDFIPIVGKLASGDGYTKLMKLNAIGFLLLGNAKHFAGNSAGYIFAGDKRIAVTVPGSGLFVQSAILTPAGREVVDLIGGSTNADPDLLDAFVTWLGSHGATPTVEDVPPASN